MHIEREAKPQIADGKQGFEDQMPKENIVFPGKSGGRRLSEETLRARRKLVVIAARYLKDLTPQELFVVTSRYVGNEPTVPSIRALQHLLGKNNHQSVAESDTRGLRLLWNRVNSPQSPQEGEQSQEAVADKIIGLYEDEKIPPYHIARILRWSREDIIKVLNERGVQFRKGGRPREMRRVKRVELSGEELVRRIIRLYRDQWAPHNIAQNLSLSREEVVQTLIDHGYAIRKGGRPRKAEAIVA